MSSGIPSRTQIGPYRITGFLGAGGMGVVWRATHRELQRDVAIKRLSDSACEGIPLERFRNEARLHSTLRHPRIATLYDYIEDDGVPCIVMEYVAGPTLEEQLRIGALAVADALRTFEMVAEAVGYLHTRGIVHRDIKPSNVKLRGDGTPVLLDFGIARATGDPRLTRTGMVIGSPHALSPEQFEGKSIDSRSDIWALGVLLYEMLTGHPPFAGDNVAVLASAILTETAVPVNVRVPSLSARLDAVVARCLLRDPAARFQTTAELTAALRAVNLKNGAQNTRLRARLPYLLQTSSRTKIAITAIVVSFFAAFGVVRTASTLSPTVPQSESSVHAPAEPAPSISASDTNAQRAAVGVHGEVVTRIALAEGVATVFANGSRVGETPYLHHAAVGMRVTLTLVRAGYRDEEVSFIVTDNQQEYTLIMQRDSSQTPAPALLGFVAWFRRKSPAPRPSTTDRRGSVTGERSISTPLEFHGVSLSDVGCVRDGNEDAVRVVQVPDGALVAVLCDGMGGYAAGEVAADLAVQALVQRAAGLNTAAALVSAVDAANGSIRRAVRENPALLGMGTTCVVLRLHGHEAMCAHVGDSRVYLIRNGGIYRLTEDHSQVRELVRGGVLADADARHHPDKNVILRALGPAEHVVATTWTAPMHLRAGDRFLLSSDGLHDLADDLELLPALALESAIDACAALILLARQRGAPDNVTVCIVDVTRRALPVAITTTGGSAP